MIGLNEGNFLLYASQHYSTPCFSDEEFYDDLKKFKYLKRLFNRYRSKNDMKERLALNHLIILYNVFGNAATPMLFLKLKGYYDILKPFLLFLSRLPSAVEIEDVKVFTDEIPLNKDIIDKLRSI